MKVTFGEFSLDEETRQITSRGEERHLSPKAFDLLALLIRRRPGVVAKDTLRQALWPGTTVVDANLNNLVAEIRAVLADAAQQPRFVRTVHRVGFAFCAEATEVPPEAIGVTRPQSGTADAGVPAGPRAWLVWQDRPIVLAPGDHVVGRDPSCDVWIDAPGVSRRHARIRVTLDTTVDGVLPSAVIEDLGSTNGTVVNDSQVRGPVPLMNGQSLRLGEAVLTFRAWAAAGASTKRIRRGS